MRKKYNTPHRRHVVKTRLSDEEYADFTERLAAYEISQSEFIRQAIRGATIRPVITVSPVNDGLLAALSKLTAEYGKIGGNLNQIARSLNEYGSPYRGLEKEVRGAAADLAASFEGRNEYISRLYSFPLLILDDFGMERGTEYGLEQVYNVIDSRYRSGRPLIVTTNLTLEDLQHPEDTAHARIYDRLIEMCSPVRFTGSNFRKATAQEKMEQLKKLMNGKEICL